MDVMTQALSPAAVPPSAGSGLPWLVADIGGTNARFGMVLSPERGAEHVHTIAVAAHAGPAEALQAYVERVRQEVGSLPRARRAAIAVATAVSGDEIAMTNSPWRFSRSALQASLRVEALLMLNDFEALALSLPKLGSHQTRTIGPDRRGQDGSAPSGALAVIGPGTGLGVGAVVRAHRSWVAVPGEGGHATLAPMNDFESDLLRHVRTAFPHVSAERLLSGIGLPILHGAVARVLGHNVPTLTSEQIVSLGSARKDLLCVQTLETFCDLLGGFAGNVALLLGARGGVYVGGGIVPRFGELFLESRFRERFEAKGRARTYLQDIPTTLITDTLAALTGAVFALEQLDN